MNKKLLERSLEKIAALTANDIEKKLTAYGIDFTRKKKAVVSGSFDPITKGHLYVISQACRMADEVHVLVATNPEKKYFFDDREGLVLESIAEELGIDLIKNGKIVIDTLPHGKFTAAAALERGAQLIVRGLRNVVDFEYEHSQQLINADISPDITTVFVMPPTNLIAVSSSAIKGIIGIEGWESVAAKYVPNCVLQSIKSRSVN